LTEGLDEYRGVPLNFKVYHVVDINAFACGDGSVRVFSALMDVMSDDELIAIIGHEIGHVYETDVKDAMKNAYLTSAALNAAGAAGGAVGRLSDSQAGELVAAFTSAQFSQKQEFAADDFGFQFSIDRGADPYGMALSLEKLVELSSGAQASAVQKMFSSHPDSRNRAARVRQRADQYVAQ
jgi:putative metalloprotease